MADDKHVMHVGHGHHQSESSTKPPLLQPAQLGEFARKPLSFGPALKILLHRAFVNLRRQPVLAFGRISQSFGLAIVLTCFFAPLRHDYYSVQSRVGYVQEVTALFFVGMLNAIAIFPAERDLFNREDVESLYSLEAFITSYTIIEIPSEIIGALLFGVLTVLAAGLPRTIKLVAIAALNAFCILSCGESLGIALMSLCTHTGLAVTLCCILMSISVHIAGVISITMPGVLRGINYISPLKWMLGNLGPYSLRGVSFTCSLDQQLPDGTCPISSGEQVLELYNLNTNASKNLGILVGVTICYRLIAYAVLKVRRIRLPQRSDKEELPLRHNQLYRGGEKEADNQADVRHGLVASPHYSAQKEYGEHQNEDDKVSDGKPEGQHG